MPFIKYSSIDTYATAEGNRLRGSEPSRKHHQFIVQHKYDGCNFQIIFEKASKYDAADSSSSSSVIKPIQFASRNRILDEHEEFNDYQTLVAKAYVKRVIENVTRYFIDSPHLTSINLYGELYGKVCKRVSYFAPSDDKSGVENELIFFDVKFNQVLKNVKFFLEWAKEMEMPAVETYLIGTFEECVAVDVTQYKTVTGDHIEGVVIKVFSCPDEESKSLRLKIKMKGFEEIRQKNKDKPPKERVVKYSASKVNCTDEVRAELDELDLYLNKNRMISVFSKRPWKSEERFVFANEVLADAFDEFKADNEEVTVDLELAKTVFLPKIFALIKYGRFFT
jgi:hypothetical protein